jgi:hypothetical protein
MSLPSESLLRLSSQRLLFLGLKFKKSFFEGLVMNFYFFRKRNVFGLVIVCLFVLFSTLAWAKNELPQADEKVSTFTSIEQDIRAVVFSHGFQSQHEKVVANVDLIARTAQNIRDFADAQGWFEMWASTPAKRRVLVVKAYEIGDPRIEAAIAYAKEKGIGKIVIISDGNIVYAPGPDQFNVGEKYSADFSKAKSTDTPSGNIMQLLLRKHRFSMNGESPHTIYLAPLGNREKLKIIDIMHEKQVIYGVLSETGELLDSRWEEGSNNLVPNPRINMRVEHNDPLGSAYAYARAMAMAEAFKNGLPINKTAPANPLRIKYIDPANPNAPTFQEIAMTDGQVNPGIRIPRLLYLAQKKGETGEPLPPDEVAKTPEVKILDVTLAHFVMTYEPGLDALKSTLETFPELKAFVLADGQFLYPLGFGKVGILAGFPSIPPFGPMVYPFPRALRDRIEAYAYIKENPEARDSVPDGPPNGRTVMHLKFSAFRLLENGAPFLDLFDGSLNFSNHEENAETQTRRRFRGDSKLGGAIVDAIKQIVVTQKDSSPKLEIGIFAELIAHLLGRSVLEISSDWINQQIELAKAKKFGEIEKNILAIADSESKHVDKKNLPDRAVVEKRLGSIVRFVQWYSTQDFFRDYKMNPVWLGVVTMLGMRLQEPKVPVVSVRKMLEFLLYEKDTDIEPRLQAAWKILQIQDEMPPPYKPGPKPPPTRQKIARTFVDSPEGRAFAPTACGEFLKAL